MEYQFDKYTKKDIVGFYEEPAKKIPIVSDVDVLVVGGSQSGVAAALAAARHGAKVQLVERFGFLGGQSVYSMVVQYEKRAFINNRGAVLTKGLPKEMLDNIIAKGGSDGCWIDPPGCPEMRDGEEWINPEAIKLTFIEMCQKAGVNLLFHTMAVDVMVDKSAAVPKLNGVIFENKTGRFAISAKVVIDASADLDLIWRALGDKGVNMREPEQRIGSGFYTWYGGINTNKFADWYINNPEATDGYPDKSNPEKVRLHFTEGKMIKIPGKTFAEFMEKADELGILEDLETIMEEVNFSGFVSLEMKWVGDDRWCLHFTSLNGVNMLDTWEVTKYEIFRQKLDNLMLKVVRLIPGWEKAYISREAMHIGSRETRALKAMKILEQDWIWDPRWETDPTPKDAIGRSGAHDPGKNMLKAGYPVPYGILVPEKLDGVIVCARAVGTELNRALDAHRGITPGMVTGQGAGTAAALSIADHVELRALDVEKLQATLRKDGVQLDHESMEFPFEIMKDRVRDKPRRLEGT